VGHKDPLTEFPNWLAPGFIERHNLRDRWRTLQQPPAPCHPVHPIAHTGLSTGFWAGVFDSEDAACIGVPIDLRAPLLDRRLLRFLLRVPPVPWCMEKALLREAMRGMLPERIRTRPKVPVLGDSIKYFIDSKKWSPVPLPKPAAAVLEYVDWKRLGATLETSLGSTHWVGLRPVSLSYWLKGIVNAERIG
jgi:asparagine synthase (glutamine-hydrolysing)